MLSDLPRNAWRIQGFPCKDVSVSAKEADERAFLLGGKRGTNAHHFSLGALGVYEDFFRALRRLERPRRLLGARRFFDDLLLDGGEFSGGDDCCGMIAALDLALIGTLEGGADSDDPARARYL